MSWWAVAGALIDGFIQQDSAHKANRTNIRLQRDQQAWEEKMSNTAVQRRREDIERAGGNPALAFTNGQEASTPSIAPARVEPTWRDPKFGTAMLMKAQIDNMKAQTRETNERARSTKIEADIREGLANAEREYRANRYVENYEWDDLKTKIMRSQVTSTAAQARQLNETVDSIISQAKSLAEKGDLDVKALRNIVNVGGLAPEDQDSIMRYIIDVIFRKK